MLGTTNIDVVQILNLGVIGLGFLLALLAYRLLAAEQRKLTNAQSPKILNSINRYMVFSLALCAIGLVSEGLKRFLTTQPSPPVSSISEILKSPKAGARAHVDFFNSTTNDVKLYRIDQQGILDPFGRIEVDAHHELDTIVGYRWLVSDSDDRPLGLYAITSPSMNIVIKDQGAPEPVPEPFVVLLSNDQGDVEPDVETIRLKRQGNVMSGEGEATDKDGTKKSWLYSGYWNGAHLVMAYRSLKSDGIGYGTFFLEQITGSGKLYKGYLEGNSCAKPGTEPPQRITKCNTVLVHGKEDGPEVRNARKDFREYLGPKGCRDVHAVSERSCPPTAAISK